MNDVILLQAIHSIFWLVIIIIIFGLFYKEIRKLLQSIGGFKVAGLSFEFKDKTETLQSHILLAETLIDLLSRTERIDALASLMLPTHVEKLSTFAVKYMEDIEQSLWNEELLRNIAYLLLRFGRYGQSVELYDTLLKSRPDHMDLLNLKALALITTRLSKNVDKAVPILMELTERYPEALDIRFNYALAKSLQSEHEVAEKEMTFVINSNYLFHNNNILLDPLFQKTKNEKPEIFKKLQALVKTRLNAQPNKNEETNTNPQAD